MDTSGREHVGRRLVAILAAAVAGYSRLIGVDEEGTLARLKKLRAIEVQRTTSPGHQRKPGKARRARSSAGDGRGADKFSRAAS